MLMVGGRTPLPPTEREAVLLAEPVPASFEATVPVWLLTVPTVLLVTLMPIWQDVPAASVTLDTFMEVEPDPVPPSVAPQALFGAFPTTERPPVRVSEKAIPDSEVEPLGLLILKTRVALPPGAIEVGLNDTVTTGEEVDPPDVE